MKKLMMTLVAMLTIAASGKAMSYEQARNEALFLTDKMAYELNLTDEQYEAAYEINLDYLMGVTSYDDVYATYWERRNLDMSYVLLDWQPPTSIVPCTGKEAIGTSASTPATRIATTSTSDAPSSMPAIVVHMPGTG